MTAVVIDISAGGSHSLALKDDGTVTGWGNNGSGQATPPAGLTGVTAISAGSDHSLALKNDGTVVGWGDDYNGQATPPAGLTGVIAISAGASHSLALKNDGTVVGWGQDGDGQATPPAGLTGVIAISASDYDHSLALKNDGTVVGWGQDSYDQSTPPAGLTDVIAISAGFAHSLALKADGTVVGWGYDRSGQATPPAGLTGVVAISAASEHSLALKNDGTVVGWGDNYYGQSTIPSGLADVASIANGSGHCLALKTDGTVVGWGRDNAGQASPPESVQPPPPEPAISAVLAISANFSGSSGDSPVIAASLTLKPKFSGYQDWMSRLGPIQLQEVYRLVITGAADGLSDLHIGGISSWQATNQADGRSSYVQAVIPAAEALLPDIQARQNGELVIQKGYKFSTGEVRFEEILRSRFDTLRPDRGQRALTVTVSGYLPGATAFSGFRTLTGIRTISIQNAKRRVRCDIDLFLQPGMTVSALGETFRAGYINYYVSQTDKFCEVGER